jgi:2-deoxy-D-gluconate 3-dehydrogenase
VALFDLKDRVAVVTGGNGGIGLGIARALAAAGASVCIVGRNPQKNEQAEQEIRSRYGLPCCAVQCDVRRREQIQHTVAAIHERLGLIRILVNNAGVNIRRRPEEYSAEEWYEILDTNLTAALWFSQAVFSDMVQLGGGKIINIGSMASLFGIPFAAPYAASKGGIVQLTKSLAVAWAPQNIQVNCILPGWIVTELTDRARQEVPGLYEAVLHRIPMRRWGQPEDLGGTAVFLASDASNYLTGVTIPVDGGYSAN